MTSGSERLYKEQIISLKRTCKNLISLWIYEHRQELPEIEEKEEKDFLGWFRNQIDSGEVDKHNLPMIIVMSMKNIENLSGDKNDES